MAYNGIKFILSAGGNPIAAARTDSFKSGAETIETSSPQSGPWRTHVTKRRDWECSCGYLVLADSALSLTGTTGIQDLLQVGRQFEITFKNGTTDPGVSGTATLTEVSITANVGKLVHGSFKFKGNGPLAARQQSSGQA